MYEIEKNEVDGYIYFISKVIDLDRPHVMRKSLMYLH